MIKEFEFYHGVALARLLHGTNFAVSLRRFAAEDNAAYILNDNIGIYIKYSTKRLPPWRFTFQKRHQDQLLEMKKHLGAAYLVLVCNGDGLVTLSFEEVSQILDDVHDRTEWISANRSKREMYAVAGSNGKLTFKIGKHDFPSKLFSGSASQAFEASV